MKILALILSVLTAETTFASGDLVAHDQAAAACAKIGQVLPSARSLADAAVPFGASIAETKFKNVSSFDDRVAKEVQAMASEDYDAIISYNPKGKPSVDFYYKWRTYKRNINANEDLWLWTSSPYPLHEKYMYFFDVGDGSLTMVEGDSTQLGYSCVNK